MESIELAELNLSSTFISNTMFFGRTTHFYQLILAVSTFSQTYSKQCIPYEWCTIIRDNNVTCCHELTRNAVAKSAVMVTENSRTISISPTPSIPKINFSLKVNTTIISYGRQILDNNKIVGGSETKFGEFPWMAVVFYSKYNQNECAGSVIQRNYILTAAHCLVGRILYLMGKPYKVRLGEYDLTTDPDCSSNNVCAPNMIEILILKTFPHPKYQSKAKSSYDIGLIKLVIEIDYSDYIQPICYDLFLGTDFSNEWFFVAGWGQTEKAEKINGLLKAATPFLNITKCTQVYNAINVRNDQICAGGDNGIDSCRGDSGAPLMLFKNKVWSAVTVPVEGLITRLCIQESTCT